MQQTSVVTDVAPAMANASRMVTPQSQAEKNAKHRLFVRAVINTVVMAVIPSSAFSITIPVILGDGQMGGLLLNLTWLNWMIDCVVTTRSTQHIKHPIMTVARLERLFRKCTTPLQLWPSIVGGDTGAASDVRVLIEEEHYNFLLKQATKREYYRFHHWVMTERCNTTEKLACLDYTVALDEKRANNEEVAPAHCDEDVALYRTDVLAFHPLLVSAYRRYACRVWPTEHGGPVKWHEIAIRLRIPEPFAVRNMISTILEERGVNASSEDLELLNVRNEWFDDYFYSAIRI